MQDVDILPGNLVMKRIPSPHSSLYVVLEATTWGTLKAVSLTGASRQLQALEAHSYKPVPGISVRQPWAGLAVTRKADLINRPNKSVYRGPLLIHAPVHEADLVLSKELHAKVHAFYRDSRCQPQFQCGGLVGLVWMTGCATSYDSQWFEGSWAYVLDTKRARRLPFLPCRGHCAFFYPRLRDEGLEMIKEAA